MRLPALAVVDARTLPGPRGPAVQHWPDSMGRVRVAAYRSEDGYCLEWPDVARFFLVPGVRTVAAAPDAACAAVTLRETFERFVVPLYWQISGGEALHASAVCRGSAALAFCATSGTGKSTIAWGMGLRGFTVLTDDGLLLDAEGMPVRIRPVSADVRLRPESSRHFGIDAQSRTTIRPAESAPLAPTLAGIMILERRSAGAAIGIHRIEGAAALAGVIAHAHNLDPHDDALRARSVSRYLQVLSTTPVWEVAYPTGLEGLGSLLDEIERAAEGVL
jgi:hypothetical protein